ncbi:MAG: hypothetical protein BZY81_06620 [SAR202 cluster bacterium Io17-Chloro-G4]|nr:MAG: hypothetical protein BZY81_06620 [SAR202 cluster bacterium Io17-Chloro-G4]
MITILPTKLVRAGILVTAALIALAACGDTNSTSASGTGPGQPAARLNQSTFFPPTTPTASVSGADDVHQALRPLAVERAFPNLEFNQLTNLAQPDDGSYRLFVTEQGGIIRVFPNRREVAEATVFLNLTDRVSRGHNEEGLLGLAFAPAFQDTGFFYVYYSASNPRRSVLSRFSVSGADSTLGDAASELVILEIPEPAGNHNGGQLAFGPDAFLYIGVGDGGRGGDPFGNGQNTGTLLGSILRIDVSSTSANEPYRVPPSNPFAAVSGSRGEIFAYGLRNPWRFSFDMSLFEKFEPGEPVEIWVADVGQNQWEEIDLVRSGGNYGWNIMEGGHCFSPPSGCPEAGLEFPVAEYGRGAGCSITGGYVYRGESLPSLTGAYVFGDFCSGSIWGMRYDGTSVTDSLLLVESGLNITSFGQDLTGEIYVLSRNAGIYRLTEPD